MFPAVMQHLLIHLRMIFPLFFFFRWPQLMISHIKAGKHPSPTEMLTFCCSCRSTIEISCCTQEQRHLFTLSTVKLNVSLSLYFCVCVPFIRVCSGPAAGSRPWQLRGLWLFSLWSVSCSWSLLGRRWMWVLMVVLPSRSFQRTVSRLLLPRPVGTFKPHNFQ